jgi:uncharacterized membrane protein (UPF0127 family)
MLVFILMLISSCGISKKRDILLSINGRPLAVELARTRNQRERGLMGRDYLGPNEGMLFIFKTDQYLSFWMKETSIPLSIAFIDENGKVTDIFDMEPYSLMPVRSSKKCRYALEVNRHFFQGSGLTVGDSIDLSVVGK